VQEKLDRLCSINKSLVKRNIELTKEISLKQVPDKTTKMAEVSAKLADMLLKMQQRADLITSNPLKLNQQQKDESFTSNPLKLTFKEDLVSDFYSYFWYLSNLFCVFKTFNSLSLVAYPTETNSINLFNLVSRKLEQSISIHKSYITMIRHYQDICRRDDLLLSCAYSTKHVLVLSGKENWAELLLFTNPDKLYSCAILLADNSDNSRIITSSCDGKEYMYLWDMRGALIKTYDKCKCIGGTLYIDTWLNSRDGNYYIINGNESSVKLYNYTNGDLLFSQSQSYCRSALFTSINALPRPRRRSR
jgi:WD40 repeat protein